MKIGVFSDVHDALDPLNRALDYFESLDIETCIFCGDFCSPIVAREMLQHDLVIHCVFGNGDGDRFTINKMAAQEGSNLILHGEYGAIELDGVALAVTHYPFYAQALARTGDYAAVFSGHTHEVDEKRFGHALCLNPGEIMGWKGAPTAAVFDLATSAAEIVKV